MDKIMEILNLEFVGNTVRQYFWFCIIILLGFIFKRLFSKLSNRLLFRLFKKYSEDISAEKFFEYLHKPTSFFLMIVFIYAGFSQLNYPSAWNLAPIGEFGLKMIIGKSYLILFISSIIWICLRIIDVFGFIMIGRVDKTPGRSDNLIVPFLIEVLKIIVITFGIFLILGSVFNLNVGSLIAGLGIGGLAVALAAKETLENLIGSFTIFLDKPFMIGDQVKVGSVTGIVEKIGFRSTRLRTAEQSLVFLPNKKMVDAELDNLSFRTRQRVLLKLVLKFETSPFQVKSIVDDVKKLIINNEKCGKDYIVRLSDFGNTGIEISVQFFIESMENNTYLEIKEDISLRILEIIKKHKALFAVSATV